MTSMYHLASSTKYPSWEGLYFPLYLQPMHWCCSVICLFHTAQVLKVYACTAGGTTEEVAGLGLHDNDGDGTNRIYQYDREELSALVLIKFEEQILAKQVRNLDRRREMVDELTRGKEK